MGSWHTSLGSGYSHCRKWLLERAEAKGVPLNSILEAVNIADERVFNKISRMLVKHINSEGIMEIVTDGQFYWLLHSEGA